MAKAKKNAVKKEERVTLEMSREAAMVCENAVIMQALIAAYTSVKERIFFMICCMPLVFPSVCASVRTGTLSSAMATNAQAGKRTAGSDIPCTIP